jgi:2-keto-4-pentenoate hydratase/2-oxohepta-3-ene-1,7-dioic acid hydratase in catechol pathway
MLRFVSFQLAPLLRTSSKPTTHVGLFFPSSNHNGKVLDLQWIPEINATMKKQNLSSLDINTFIEQHSSFMPSLTRFISNPTHTEDMIGKCGLDIGKSKTSNTSVTLLSPIPLPKRNIMCVGKNYKDHIAEVAKFDKIHGIGSTSGGVSAAPAVEAPKYPQFFTKAPNAVIGPNEMIENHQDLTKWLDYEAEVAVIIGKKGL